MGDTANENTQIRGFAGSNFELSPGYLIGSLEYRYNFGLETSFTQTIIGIVFADLGYCQRT
ncbi:MAG: hypothetical protein R2865_03500 [Deinococcales bacterium]